MRSRIAVAAYEPEAAAPGRLPSELGECPPFPYARREKRALKSSYGKRLAHGILRLGVRDGIHAQKDQVRAAQPVRGAARLAGEDLDLAGLFPADVHGSPLHAFVSADDDRAHNTSCVFLKLASANLFPKK